MKPPITNDNIYKVGDIVSEKIKPKVELKIESYKKRIYYCSFVEFPDRKHIVLFEREILKQ